MACSTSDTPNAFVTLAKRVYNPMGFAKGYNFMLWFILCGALLGFSLSRLMFLDIDGVYCNPNSKVGGSVVSECYYFMKGKGRTGLLLHMATILPAGILVVFQFLPVIRYKFLLFHRISGYIILLLSIVSTAGVFMISDHAFGGSLALQASSGLSAIVFIVSLILAYYNIKRLQIDQHRAWMIRAWAWATSIVSMRLISMCMTRIIGRAGGDVYTTMPCYILDAVFFHKQQRVEQLYPGCAAYYAGSNSAAHVAVHADMESQRYDQAISTIYAAAGPSSWLAVALHAVLAEVYLWLTPRETARLRQVSYQRQMEAGMKNPGNAGLTVQRIGDAEPWVPSEVAEQAAGESQVEKDTVSSRSDDSSP